MTSLQNTIRRRRHSAGLSQKALGQLVGVTRQALIAIEAGRQVPSTLVSLRLAAALGCRVEDLFQLGGEETITATVVGTPASARVTLGTVRGRTIAHPAGLDGGQTADGILESPLTAGSATVRLLTANTDVLSNVLVAGCAPILAALSERVARGSAASRMIWIPASSTRALDLLVTGLAHVAGVHLFDESRGTDNTAVVRERFPDRAMVVVNLVSWRQGLVVAAGNPLGIHQLSDLSRGSLRLAQRDEGAGATKLLRRSVPTGLPGGPHVSGHLDVARAVALGGADVGVAIENVALAMGLDFIPLVEERFDLVIPADLAETAPVARLISAVGGRAFREDVRGLAGYDAGFTGSVTTVQVAA